MRYREPYIIITHRNRCVGVGAIALTRLSGWHGGAGDLTGASARVTYGYPMELYSELCFWVFILGY
jgi:hypothetical protein